MRHRNKCSLPRTRARKTPSPAAKGAFSGRGSGQNWGFSGAGEGLRRCQSRFLARFLRLNFRRHLRGVELYKNHAPTAKVSGKVSEKVGRKVGEPTSWPPTLPTMALFTSPGRESPPVRPVVPVFNVLVLLVDTFCAVRARTLSLCSCVPPTVQNGCRRNGGCWWWFAINGAKNRATGPIWWLAGGVMWWHRSARNDVPTKGRCIP